MKNINFLISALAVLLTVGCSSGPVSSSKDPGADLAKYHSYRWISPAEAKDLRLDNPSIEYVTGGVRIVQRPQIEDKLRPAVEKELKQNGFVPASEGAPDFFVTYYGKSKGDEWVSTWAGLAPGIDNVPVVIFPGYDRSQTRDYREGTVFLTFYDARSKNPAWTGRFQSEKLSPNIDDQKLAKSVALLISEFQKSS
jgi:hypothetical protein